MEKIPLFDRNSQVLLDEQIVAPRILSLLYGKTLFSKIFYFLFSQTIARFSFFSKFYGFLQKRKFSRKKIEKFVNEFAIDMSEYKIPKEGFSSFNDFFIRKIKKKKRPFSLEKNIAILPADARYMVFQDLSCVEGFYVKGQKFSLSSFLQNDILAKNYKDGAMMIARLSPVDYHRFHFPFDCIPSKTKNINGYYYSVNTRALKKNIHTFSENKRVLTLLESDVFGKVLFVEVGATYVGTIHQTYVPNQPHNKGEEKGYFSFGGSSIVMLFEKDEIVFDADLLKMSSKYIETRALFGQSLGKSLIS